MAQPETEEQTSSDPLEDNDESFVLMAVFHAVEDGNLQGIKELVENLTTFDPNQKNKHGETALHMASGQGHKDIVEYLLTKGSTIDIKDKHGDNAIYWAARQGQVALIEYLKENGCPLNDQNRTRETPLHVASRYGQVEAAQYLCSLGINVDIQDEDGETPIHISAWHGYMNIVQTLCNTSANLDLRNKDGETPLICASARGHLEIVSILVKSRAFLNNSDKQGLSALHHAVRRHHYNIVRYLCENDCNVNMQDKFGETSLHVAAKDGSLHILELLHCAGCNVDTLNKCESTALQLAAKHGHIEIVRYLCLAGCKLDHRNKDGLTAVQIATLEGHEDVVLIFKQLQGEKMREVYVHQLSSSSGPLSRIRLKIFGHQGVGKSSLIDSLKCGYLRGLFRRSKSNLSLIGRSATKKYMASKENLMGRSLSTSSADQDYNGTRGIDVSQINIPGAGDYTVMEFPGAESYHTSYCHFMDDDGAINLIVFRLDDTFEDQLAQVTYWMNYLKSRLPVSEPIGHCGKYSQQMKIALVATHADYRTCPKLPSGELISGEGNIVLYQIKKSFGRLFDICEMLFVVDANNSQSRDMKLLRTHLSNLRNAVVKQEPPLTVLCEAVLSILPTWRKNEKCQSFPVLTWQQFEDMVHTQINPLASEPHLKDVVRQLHYMGEVQCFMSELLQEIILIEPRWLCSNIIGQLLSPDTTDQPYGQYSVHYIQSVFPETDCVDIVQLLEAMDICTQGTVCEFPSLIKSNTPLGIWEKEDENGNLNVYGGVRLQIAECTSVLPIGLFARIQLSLRRNFQQDVEDLDTDLVLWKDGAKCVSGSMEALLVLTNEGQGIEVRVRGISDTRQGCFVFMEDLVHLVKNVVEESYPGLLLNQDMLSPTQLRNHDRFLMTYEPKHIFQAQISKERTVQNEITEEMESFTDLFCFGSDSIEANTIPGIDLHIVDLPELTRRQLSMLLDPPDPMGKDWCLMALSLGMMDRVPVLDPLNNRCGPEESDSPTERTLQEWGSDPGSTIGTLIKKLKDLGREDAARVILNSMPLYKFLPDPQAMEEGHLRINSTPNNSSSTVASR
ncbi:death-associated protein kinase 1-like isoform X1 [Asterias rubens]|uniref:death-associated protein kinase 1-like isoform X1 n=2 Tax=Asterias rubens TaxID=7604 RepID=UPI001455723B|nr:death-associated protein kinase 1-like isoform X1 [Asterias rubens]